MNARIGMKTALFLAVATARTWCVSAHDPFGSVVETSPSDHIQQQTQWHRHLQNGTNTTGGTSPNMTGEGGAVELQNCQVTGTQFTCVVPTDYVYAPGTETEILFSVTCDLDQSIGPNIDQSSGCVCSAEVNEFMNGTLAQVRACGCNPCPNNTMGVDFGLNCSNGPNDPFTIRPGEPFCSVIDCSGQCSSGLPGGGANGNGTTAQPMAVTVAPTTPGATTVPVSSATTAPTTTPGSNVSTTSPPGTNDTTTSPPVPATPATMVPSTNETASSGADIFNHTAPTGPPTNDTTTADGNQTMAPTASPTPPPPSTTCSVRGQAGSGFTITGSSIVCNGSDACAGGLISSCQNVACGQRDCTGTTIVNASTVFCEGESACRLAIIGEPDNPVDSVHCQGKNWACYQATIFANETVICEDNSGECLVQENGICGFANLSTPCLQCIGTNHGCGAAGSCKLNGEACPEYRYGGQTCEAACPEDQDCKMNDTIHECGDAEKSGGEALNSMSSLLVGTTAMVVALLVL